MRAAYALMTLGVCLLITALMMPSEASEGAKELQLASAHLAAQTAVERLQAAKSLIARVVTCPAPISLIPALRKRTSPARSSTMPSRSTCACPTPISRVTHFGTPI